MDECRQTGSISEALVTLLVEAQVLDQHQDISRITADDSFIPLGTAAYHVLPSTQAIVDKATSMLAGENS